MTQVKQSKLSVKQLNEKSNRAVTMIKLGKTVIKTEVADTVPGEFPMEEWCTFPLEVPSDGFRQHILGRFPGGCETRLVEPHSESEVIHLPVYSGEEITDARAFDAFRGGSDAIGLSAKVPVITLAAKFTQKKNGQSSQALYVLPIWKDSTSLLLELYWAEGNPEEDGLNPEWHIESSAKVPVDQALAKLRESCRHLPNSADSKYFLYLNPPSLGEHVLGEGRECESKIWPREWPFDRNDKMLDALDQLADIIVQVEKD
jgi:hypothetical protein